MFSRVKHVLAYTALCFFFFVMSAMTPPGPTYDVSWFTIDAGGGTSGDATYEVSGTVGQPDSAVMVGGVFEITGGYWSGIALPCPADITGNAEVNVSDLLELLAAWGECPAPCPADINSDGSVNVTDLLLLLAAWGVCP